MATKKSKKANDGKAKPAPRTAAGSHSSTVCGVTVAVALRHHRISAVRPRHSARVEAMPFE